MLGILYIRMRYHNDATARGNWDVRSVLTATVILEMIGYKKGSEHYREHPPWHIQSKIRATRREVSWIAKLQKGKMINKGVVSCLVECFCYVLALI